MRRVEARTLTREPYRQAWAVAYLGALVPGASSAAFHLGAGPEHATWYLSGVVAGVAWQLLNRRDLTSRLTWLAVLAAIAVTSALVTGKDIVWDEMNTKGLYVVGALLGLIFTEQALRHSRAPLVRKPRHEP